MLIREERTIFHHLDKCVHVNAEIPDLVIPARFRDEHHISYAFINMSVEIRRLLGNENHGFRKVGNQ